MLDRFNAGLPLVERIARRVARDVDSSVELDDLVAAGREGLLQASRRFDPARGVPFGAYATRRIRGAMYDTVRKMADLPRRAYQRILADRAMADVSEAEAEYCYRRAKEPIDEADAEDALHENLAAMATGAALAVSTVTARPSRQGAQLVSEQPSPEQALERAELVAVVRRCLGELSANEAELIERYYFADEHLGEIADRRSMTKFWASRLHARALERLARMLGDRT